MRAFGRLIAISNCLGRLPAALVNNLDNKVGHRARRARHFHLSHASTCLSFPIAFAARPAIEGWRVPIRANGIYSQAGSITA